MLCEKEGCLHHDGFKMYSISLPDVLTRNPSLMSVTVRSSLFTIASDWAE